MKSNLKSLVIATAIALVGLSGCNKSATDNTLTKNGDPTDLQIKLNFTPSSLTKATSDKTAIDAEVAIKTVHVFIFDNANAGALQLPVPSFTLADFNETGPSDTYTIKDTKKITTTVGSKDIYIGVNLPAAIVSQITNKAALQTAWTGVLSNLVAADGSLAMFSREVVTGTLVAKTASDHGTKNTVTVGVDRMVAKIAVEKGTSATPMTEVGAGAFADYGFSVRRSYTKMYPLQKTVSSIMEVPSMTRAYVAGDYQNFGAADGTGYTALNNNHVQADKTGANTLPYAYAMENAFTIPSTGDNDADTKLTRNLGTYVSVRVQFIPTNFSTYNTGTGVLGTTASSGTAKTFWFVRAGSNKYFFSVKDEAVNYVNSVAGRAASAEMINSEYTNGYGYYAAFINSGSGVAAGLKYKVLRNSFYNVVINKITAPGYPTDEPDHEFIVGEDTDIKFTINVFPWAYEAQSFDLEW